jgi:hypothetical protein
MVQDLNTLIRPNVLYLAVSQSDNGPIDYDKGGFDLGPVHGNILVLSSGGYGHVPLPLVHGDNGHPTDLALPQLPPPLRFERTLAFFGRITSDSRRQTIGNITEACSALNVSAHFGESGSWVEEMGVTRFNLAPRGFGRNSFRYTEIIQLGRVPVFLWDDVPWIPYEGTSLGADSLGLSAGLSHPGRPMYDLVSRAASMPEAEFQAKLAAVRGAREHFTFAGVLKQIELLLANPFSEEPGGSSLRCTKHPRTQI